MNNQQHTLKRRRKLRDRVTAVVAAVGALAMTTGFMMMAASGTAQADDNSAPQDHKVYVCKVVGGPGNYRYQTGNNPIHVSVSAIGGDVRAAGSPFKDAQPSVVLDYNGVGKPDLNACPALPPDKCPDGSTPVDGLCPTPPPDDCADDDTERSANTNDKCVTAVDPKVHQSAKCDVEGSYTIYYTKGVDYYLDGVKIPVGTHYGPESGTITAQAEDGYELTNPGFSYALHVMEAEDCPPPPQDCVEDDTSHSSLARTGTKDDDDNDNVKCVTAVPPVVHQSPACDVEGSYEIPDTKGVDYYNGAQLLTPGVHAGPASFTITAKPEDNHELTNPGFSYVLKVAPAKDCPPGIPQKPNPIVVTSSVPSTDCDAKVVTTVTTTTTTDYTLVGTQWVLGTPVTTTQTATRPATDQECPPPPPPTTNPPPVVDVCPNINGNQPKVPKGMTKNSDGDCVEPQVAPTGTATPKPTKKPTIVGTEAVPTAVDAGLPGGPTFTSSSPTDLLAKSLVGAGLALLMAAGWMQMGRRTRGVHQV